MKFIGLTILSIFATVSCKEKTEETDICRIDRFSSDVLTPKDLNIQKETFVAQPSEKEVAIFRTELINSLKPYQNLIYDQISWNNKGEKIFKNVVISARSYYIDYPEEIPKTEENIFRDNWRLRAGMYRYDVNDYSFLGSEFSSSGDQANGQVAYTKKTKSKTKDLEFKFKMFIVSLEEAKKIHPELDVVRDEGTNSWQAAFFYDNETNQTKMHNKTKQSTPTAPL